MNSKNLPERGSRFSVSNITDQKFLPLIVAFIIVFSTVTIASAQQFVSGKIVDATSRQPLVAASIVEDKNGKHTAVTDQDGNFLIKVTNLNSRLIASFIGYQSTSINVTGKQHVRI